MRIEIGVHVPTILLPKPDTDMSAWSVVACDQYTSQPEYWKTVEKTVGQSPSTLHITLPEVYLEKEDKEERIAKINRTMTTYLKENILVPQGQGFIYVERETTHGHSRKGLVLAVDLEAYDYAKGANSLIRATEGTVIERLPPRIKIRESAVVELPHILLLIDDEDKTVIEPLSGITNQLEKLYDFDLMMDGGHIRGYKVGDSQFVDAVMKSLGKLAEPDVFQSKYNVSADKGVLLFAVGDGNHSLASAKAFWENLKNTLPEEELENHPARFALVELVNVHDEGLQFEPIHRVVFSVDPEHLLKEMIQYYTALGCEAQYKIFTSMEKMQKESQAAKAAHSCHVIPFITSSFSGFAEVLCPQYNLEVGTLQDFLDQFLSGNPDARIDYIHGDKVVEALGSQPGNIGFFLPSMNKRDLFKTVILDGALPRKTFSMGEADEKRFYLECRKIR